MLHKVLPMAESRLQAAVVSALVLLVLLHQGKFALQVLLSDPLYFNAQREVVFWGADAFRPQPERVAGVRESMDRALRWWPEHPDYLGLKARLQIWQGLVAPDRGAAAEQFRLAIDSMEASLAVRPGNPYSWAQYAEYLKTQPERAADLALAIRKVELLGSGDPILQQRMRALSGP